MPQINRHSQILSQLYDNMQLMQTKQIISSETENSLESIPVTGKQSLFADILRCPWEEFQGLSWIILDEF